MLRKQTIRSAFMLTMHIMMIGLKVLALGRYRIVCDYAILLILQAEAGLLCTYMTTQHLAVGVALSRLLRRSLTVAIVAVRLLGRGLAVAVISVRLFRRGLTVAV